jgi:hypothetical protein
MTCGRYGWKRPSRRPRIDHYYSASSPRPTSSTALSRGVLEGKKRKEEEEAKKKKRRVNPKFAKLTNTHLAGTPIGDVLQAALEGRDIEGSATGGARFDVA